MRNHLKQKVTVGAPHVVELDLRIENANWPSLPVEWLDQVNGRAFPELIGVLFEGKPKNPDRAGGQIQHRTDRALQMLAVARQDRFEQGDFKIQPRSAIRERA